MHCDSTRERGLYAIRCEHLEPVKRSCQGKNLCLDHQTSRVAGQANFAKVSQEEKWQRRCDGDPNSKSSMGHAEWLVYERLLSNILDCSYHLMQAAFNFPSLYHLPMHACRFDSFHIIIVS